MGSMGNRYRLQSYQYGDEKNKSNEKTGPQNGTSYRFHRIRPLRFEAQLGGWREIHGILPFDIHLRQQLFLNNVCEH